MSDEECLHDSRFYGLVARYPRLSRYIPLYHWLCRIYDSADKTSFFPYIRTDDIDGFLAHCQSQGWQAAGYGGAFSSTAYGQWRDAALELLDIETVPEAEKLILSVLTGDRETLRQFEKTWFDRVWSDLFCFFCRARHDSPELACFCEPVTPFERAVMEVVDGKLESIGSIHGLPLSLRIHVSAILRHNDPDLLQRYIDVLVSQGLFGLAVFYGSLAGQEVGTSLLAKVLVGLPKADKNAITLAAQFGLSPAALASQIAETIIHAKKSDFEVGLSSNELRARKIASIGWLMLVPEAKDTHRAMVRELMHDMIMNEDFRGAREVFTSFEDAWNIADYRKEKKCWEVLLKGETEFEKWKKHGDNGPEAKQRLTEILKFPSGWMRGCAGVDLAIGKKWIPLVTRHLHEVMTGMGENDHAMGVSP
jgi:hypothetical protein